VSFTVSATQTTATANGMAIIVRAPTGFAASQGGATANAQQATPSLSVTPGNSGSLVYGALLTNNNAQTALAASTPFLTNINNNSLHYIGFVSNAATTAGISIGPLGATGTVNGIAIALCEVQATATLTDAAGGAGSTSAAHTVTTGAFTPAGGALLVAMIASNGFTGTTSMAVTDTSGLGYVWTEQVAQKGGSHGYAGVWTAQIPSPSASAPLLATFLP
jgi:hypothetical protein